MWFWLKKKNEAKNEAGCYQNYMASLFNLSVRLCRSSNYKPLSSITPLVRLWVQESLTQPQNHPLIVIAMKCSVKSRDESLVPSLLFCPEQNEPNFVAWSQQHQRHPGEKVRQPKLLRMIKWYKMAQPYCYTLNHSDGNSSVFPISNDAAAKSSAGGQKPSHCSNQHGCIFKCRAQLRYSLRWTEIVFLKF